MYEIDFWNSIQDWAFYHYLLVVKMLRISPELKDVC